MDIAGWSCKSMNAVIESTNTGTSSTTSTSTSKKASNITSISMQNHLLSPKAKTTQDERKMIIFTKQQKIIKLIISIWHQNKIIIADVISQRYLSYFDADLIWHINIGIMENYQELKGRFREVVDGIKGGPAEQRTTKDICCYVFFVLAVLAFLVLGIFVMADQSSALGQAINNPQELNSSNIFAVVFSKYPGLISVMFLIGIGIALLYLILVRYYLRCIIYGMVICVFCILFAILVIAISNNSIGLIIAMSISIVLFLVFVICMRAEIELGMKLMETASRFVADRPSVYLAGLWVFFCSVIFFIFWAVSIVAVQMRANMHIDQKASTSGDMGIMGYFIFIYIFISIFLYYVLSFHVTTACALWYYNIEGGYFCVATGRINRYHIGSFTFAALLLTLVRILQIMINASRSQSDNACYRCIKCFISCILAQIEYMLRVLNSTAVSVIAVTGESYWDAAKTATYLLHDTFGLYSAVSVISNLVMLGGVITAVGIPTIIGYLYCEKRFSPSQQQLDHLGLIIFFGTIILVLFLIGTLCEALNSVYVIHCLDLRLNECGCMMANNQVLKDINAQNNQHLANSAHQLEDNKKI